MRIDNNSTVEALTRFPAVFIDYLFEIGDDLLLGVILKQQNMNGSERFSDQ